MTKNKQYITSFTEVIPFAVAHRMGVEGIINLSTILESMSVDGKVPYVKRIRFSMDTVKDAVMTLPGTYLVRPIVVQTAGTITDTVDIAIDNDIASVLATVINDEFGFQYIGDWRHSKLKSLGGDASIEYLVKRQMQFDIPNNVIGLLRKQVNTERLQDIHLVLLSCNNDDAGLEIHVNGKIFIDYVESSKGITIR